MRFELKDYHRNVSNEELINDVLRVKMIYGKDTLTKAEYKHAERFNLEVPQSVTDVPSEVLNPRDTWSDKSAYDAQADKLAKMFMENFEKKYPNMPSEIKNAGPKA